MGKIAVCGLWIGLLLFMVTEQHQLGKRIDPNN